MTTDPSHKTYTTTNEAWQDIKQVWSEINAQAVSYHWDKPTLDLGDEPTEAQMDAVVSGINKALDILQKLALSANQVCINNSSTAFGRASMGYGLACQEREDIQAQRQKMTDRWARVARARAFIRRAS